MAPTAPAPVATWALPAEAAGWSDDLVLLLGPDATDLLSLLVGHGGGELRSWSPRQITHQPGSSTVVQYLAQVAWPDGRHRDETLVATTGSRVPDGAMVVEADGTRVGLWAYPNDPALPGLAAALDHDRVAALLGGLGLGEGALRLRVRAYRPGRRAVVEATGARGRLFLKVVRPHRVQAIHDKHRLLAAHVPVPDSLGWSSDGILVLPGLGGRTLRQVLADARFPAPDPAGILALLDRLPAALAGDATDLAADHLRRVEHYAAVLAAAQPDLRDRLDALLARIGGPAGHHPVVPVHGDLYEAQLLVDGGRVTGLLDVDTAGPGHRIDDLATMVAHLSVLALVSDDARTVKRYGARFLAEAEARHDRADLRRRVAAAVLGLATGCFRVLEPTWQHGTRRRIELAEAWLEEAAPS